MEKKTIKAWAVVYQNFQPVGNGNQYQYPIFKSHKDAVAFSKETHGDFKDIVPVTITY